MGITLNPKTGFGVFSKLHTFADPFTRDVQTPFSEKTKAYLDELTSARNAGTLTYDQAQSTLDRLEDDYANFKFKADEYALQGDSQYKISEQARRTIDPYYEQWKATLQGDVKNLQPAMDPGAIPTIDTILGNRTGRQAAQQAGDQRRKRVKNSGYLATVLTKYKGTTGATAKPPALTGY